MSQQSYGRQPVSNPGPSPVVAESPERPSADKLGGSTEPPSLTVKDLRAAILNEAALQARGLGLGEDWFDGYRQAVEHTLTLLEGGGVATRIFVRGLTTAGWRPPAQVIDSESELEELPVGVVILTEQGRVARKTEDPSPTSARPYGYWEELGEELEVQTDELDDLPATVLYIPTEEPTR